MCSWPKYPIKNTGGSAIQVTGISSFQFWPDRRPSLCAAEPLRGRAFARPSLCAAKPLRGRAFARRCLPLRGKGRAAPGENVLGLLFSHHCAPSRRRHASRAGKDAAFLASAALPCRARGAASVRVRRCLPCGQRRCRVARRIFWRIAKGNRLRSVLPIRLPYRRAGERTARVSMPGMELRTIPQTEHALSRHSFHIIRAQQRQHQARLPAIAFRGEHPACAPGLPSPQNPGFSPFPPPPYSPAIPQGERRALPAPAQGSRPLRIPFGGTAASFPVSASPNRRRRQVPARGLAAV